MTDKERMLQIRRKATALSEETDDVRWQLKAAEMLSKSDLFLANYLAYKDLILLRVTADKLAKKREELERELAALELRLDLN